MSLVPKHPLAASAALLLAGSLPLGAAEGRTSGSNSTVYTGNGEQYGGQVHTPAASVAPIVQSPTALTVGESGSGPNNVPPPSTLTPEQQAAALLNDKKFVGPLLTDQGDLRQGPLQEAMSQNGMMERRPDGKGWQMNELGWTVFTGLVQAGRNIRDQVQTGRTETTGPPATTQPPDATELPPAVSVKAGTVLTAIAPAEPRAWALLGDGLAGTGKPDKAVPEYTKALELGAPPPVRYKRGLAAERAGDHELANADALAVLKASPGDAEAHALYMLTRGRSSSVHLIDGAQAAAGLGQGTVAGQAVATARGVWQQTERSHCGSTLCT